MSLPLPKCRSIYCAVCNRAAVLQPSIHFWVNPTNKQKVTSTRSSIGGNNRPGVELWTTKNGTVENNCWQFVQSLGWKKTANLLASWLDSESVDHASFCRLIIIYINDGLASLLPDKCLKVWGFPDSSEINDAPTIKQVKLVRTMPWTYRVMLSWSRPWSRGVNLMTNRKKRWSPIATKSSGQTRTPRTKTGWLMWRVDLLVPVWGKTFCGRWLTSNKLPQFYYFTLPPCSKVLSAFALPRFDMG